MDDRKIPPHARGAGRLIARLRLFQELFGVKSSWCDRRQSTCRGPTRQNCQVRGWRRLIDLSIGLSANAIISDLIDNQLPLPFFSSVSTLVISDLKRKFVGRANITAIAEANVGFKMIEDFDKTHIIAHSNESTPPFAAPVILLTNKTTMQRPCHYALAKLSCGAANVIVILSTPISQSRRAFRR